MAENECTHGKSHPRFCAACRARAEEAIERLRGFGMTDAEIIELLEKRKKMDHL
jgi:hypothetical protein